MVDRALPLFDRIIVAIGTNAGKESADSDETARRIRKIAEIYADESGVEVYSYEGLTVDFARQNNACALLRGLRAVSDFDYEFQLALMNRRLSRNVETVFMMTDYQWLYISSTIIKAVASQGGNIGGLVPENVRRALEKKYELC